MLRRTFVILLIAGSSLLPGGLVVGRSGTPIARAVVPGANAKILFDGEGLSPGASALRSIDPDGTNNVLVLAGATGGRWSPDGTQIATSILDPDGIHADIYVMKADGTELTNLTNTPDTYDFGPAWSPDGAEIAFQSSPSPLLDFDIWVMEADGDGAHPVTPQPQPSFGEGLDWSPDGALLLFDSSDGLKTVPATGGIVLLLTDLCLQGRWSPDGSKVACVSSVAPLANYSIVTVDADGGGFHVVKVADPEVQFILQPPIWSPDGTKMLWMPYLPEPPPSTALAPNIFIMGSDGSGSAPFHDLQGIATDWAAAPLPVDSIEFTQAIQELQTIPELQADLAADGEPPVPLIEGKPAVMRIYFREVPDSRVYQVQVSGVLNLATDFVVSPGCTALMRRRQDSLCQSADFYFKPPAGNWSETVTIRDEQGNILESHQFDFTSRHSESVILKAVSVCGDLLGASCGLASQLSRDVVTLRQIAPTAAVGVITTKDIITVPLGSYGGIVWWLLAVDSLGDMYNSVDAAVDAANDWETYYFGMANLPPGSGVTSGIADGIPARAAMSLEFQPAVVAHEWFHAAGRHHTATAIPTSKCWESLDPGTDWPYADNALRSGDLPGVIEVGFDVAGRIAIPGDTNYEVMGYCKQSWVSPFTYVKSLDPSGPLDPERAVSSRVEGTFWSVRGAITEDGLQLLPLFTVDADGEAGQGSGSFAIEVRDDGGTVLFTRHFNPSVATPFIDQGGEQPPPMPMVSELIPVTANAATIVVLDDQATELGRHTLGGEAPSVTVDTAGVTGGNVVVSWTVTDADSSQHSTSLEYSLDGGQSWFDLAFFLPGTQFSLPMSMLAGSDTAQIRAAVSDGVNTGSATSTPFVIPRKLPQADIVSPIRTLFHDGDLVWLQAAAFDPDDGALDGASVTWSSSIDLALGSGASLPVYDLSPGTHTITLTATDSDNNVATDSIVVTVNEGVVVEGQVRWGDNNCSGVVDSADVLVLLSALVGLASDGAGCIATGAATSVAGLIQHWGDVDCSDNIDLADVLTLMRSIAQLPPGSPSAGCPAVGAMIVATPP